MVRPGRHQLCFLADLQRGEETHRLHSHLGLQGLAEPGEIISGTQFDRTRLSVIGRLSSGHGAVLRICSRLQTLTSPKKSVFSVNFTSGLGREFYQRRR